MGAHPQPSRCYDLDFPRKHGVGETLLPTIAIVQSRKSARADWLSESRKKQGELELAKNYAARCYKTLIDSDFLKDARLETLLKQWPDIAKPYGFVCDCRLVTLAPHNN